MPGYVNGIPHATSTDRIDLWPTTSRTIAQWVDDNVPRNDDPRLTNPRPPTTHTHPISGVTGLQAALNGKTDTTDPRLSDARPPTEHQHTLADVDGIVVDTSAGTRVSIGGVNVFYDSGWRDLRALLIPEVLIPGEGSHRSLRARRSLDRVEYLIRLTVGAGLAGKSRAARTTFVEGIPASLEQAPAAYSTLGQVNGSDGVISVSNSASTTSLNITSTQPGSWELGETIFIYISHNTNAALPTSLPGDPA